MTRSNKEKPRQNGEGFERDFDADAPVLPELNAAFGTSSDTSTEVSGANDAFLEKNNTDLRTKIFDRITELKKQRPRSFKNSPEGVMNRIDEDISYFTSDTFREEDFPSPFARVKEVQGAIKEATDDKALRALLRSLFEESGIITDDSSIPEEELSAWDEYQSNMTYIRPGHEEKDAPLQTEEQAVQSKAPHKPMNEKPNTKAEKSKVEVKPEKVNAQTYQEALETDREFVEFLSRFPDGADESELGPDKLQQRFEIYKAKEPLTQEVRVLANEAIFEELGFAHDEESKMEIARRIDDLAIVEGGHERFMESAVAVEKYKNLDAEYTDMVNELAGLLNVELPKDEGVVDVSFIIETAEAKFNEQERDFTALQAKSEVFEEYRNASLVEKNMLFIKGFCENLFGRKDKKIEVLNNRLQSEFINHSEYEREMEKITRTARLQQTRVELEKQGLLGTTFGIEGLDKQGLNKALASLVERAHVIEKKSDGGAVIVEQIKQMSEQYNVLRTNVLKSFMQTDELAHIAKKQFERRIADIAKKSVDNVTFDQFKLEFKRLERVYTGAEELEFLAGMQKHFGDGEAEKIKGTLEEYTKSLMDAYLQKELADKDWAKGSMTKLVSFIKKHIESPDKRVGAISTEDMKTFIYEKIVEEIKNPKVTPARRIILKASLSELLGKAA